MDNKLIGTIMTIVVGIILTGALLVPIVTDAQAKSGDEITKTTDGASEIRSDYYTEDVTVIITSATDATTAGDATVTVNGDTVTNDSGISVPIVFTLNTYISLADDSADSIGYYRFYSTTTPTMGNFAFGHTYTITYDASEDTVSMTDKDLSDNTTSTVVSDLDTAYFFAAKEGGAYAYGHRDSYTFGNFYVNDSMLSSDLLGLFRLAGTATVGETTVKYVVVVSDASVDVIVDSGYTATVSLEVLNEELVDGTADIYNHGVAYLNLTISDDDSDDVYSAALVPLDFWALDSADGHDATGPAYAVYAVVPVVVIIAIMMLAVGMIRSKE